MSYTQYKCHNPTTDQLIECSTITNQQVKFFVVKGTNRLPSQIHLAVIEGNKKIRGHNLIPNELPPNFKYYDSLTEAYNYNCPCGKKDCQYSSYLKQVVDNFRIQITRV